MLISGVLLWSAIAETGKRRLGGWLRCTACGNLGYHDVDEGFAIVQRRQVDSDIAAAVWRKIAHTCCWLASVAPSARTSTRRVVIQRREPELIIDAQLAAGDVGRLNFYRGDNLLVLSGARVQASGRRKSARRGRSCSYGIVAVVAAEFVPYRTAIVGGLDSVIAPLPYVVALNTVMLIEHVWYSLSPPGPLPIAWAYSQIIRGLACGYSQIRSSAVRGYTWWRRYPPPPRRDPLRNAPAGIIDRLSGVIHRANVQP